MSEILLPPPSPPIVFSCWFLSLVSTVNMTFILLVSGFESADLALKLKVLTGASLSTVLSNRLLCSRIKAGACEMVNWNVRDRLALPPALKGFLVPS